MKKVIFSMAFLSATGICSAQTMADVTSKALPKSTSRLVKGTYTRNNKGLEAIQTLHNTILIDYVVKTVEHNGVLYPILTSDCTVYPPAVKLTYGKILLTTLTIYYDPSGNYAGHSIE